MGELLESAFSEDLTDFVSAKGDLFETEKDEV